MRRTVLIALLALWLLPSCKTVRKTRTSSSRIDSSEIKTVQASELFAGRNIQAQIIIRTYDPTLADSTGVAPLVKETKADICINDSLTAAITQEETVKEGSQEMARNEEYKSRKNIAAGVAIVFGIVVVSIVIVMIITALK